MAHYCIADIHNNYKAFQKMLEKIHFSPSDTVYVLGDIFDRTDCDPQPIELYFKLLALNKNVVILRGNHDQLLAEYIQKYYTLPERKRRKMEPYPYNTFSLLQERLTPVDVQNLAEHIFSWPLQVQIEVNGTKYLLAHAQTQDPLEKGDEELYLTGSNNRMYEENGIAGYVSVTGHFNTSGVIWENDKRNVYRIDCGCGFRSSGKLGCLCLETREEFYVDP